jgi:3-phosphoglycerate kinase
MTGGGSTITYLAGQELPALKPFLENGAKTNNAQSIK